MEQWDTARGVACVAVGCPQHQPAMTCQVSAVSYVLFAVPFFSVPSNALFATLILCDSLRFPVGYGYDFLGLGVRAGNDVHANQFANATGRCSARIRSGLHSAHITSNANRHKAGADILLAYQCHIGCLHHGISSFNSANKSLRFDHSQGFV